MNKAEKFIARVIREADPEFDISWVVHNAVSEKFNLESGYSDAPNKNIPPEYKAAIKKLVHDLP